MEIADAMVSLSGKNNLLQAASSDSLGSFSFGNLKPGLYTIKISNIGYEGTTMSFLLSRDTTINITLRSSNKQLNEVTIIANKATIENNTEKTIYNVSSSITANGTDALTTIEKIPGIRVSNGEISMVGKGQVKVMINGRIIQLDGTDLTRYLQSISANQVSKIEVIKNPSAQYDAEGNAGLINITTRQSKKDGLSGNVQLSDKRWLHSPAEVYNTKNYWMTNGSANLNYNATKFSAYGSLNLMGDHELEGFETDVFYPNQTWKQTDTGNYRVHDVNYVLGFDYKLSPKTSIGASYIGGSNTADGSDHVNNPVYAKSGQLDSTLHTYATYHPIALSNSVNAHTIINFDTTGKKLLINADYFNYYRTDHSNFTSDTFLPDGWALPSSDANYFDTNKQDINIYTLATDAEIPTRFAKIAFGGKLSFIDTYSNAFYYNVAADDTRTYNTNLSNEFDYKENTQSLYINLDGAKGKWKYQAGLRGELTETKAYSFTLDQTALQKYFKPFPSFLLSYQADTANSFAFTAGRRINRPTFWNLNPFKSLFTAYSFGEGNPFLQPEYNTNFELSHDYKSILHSAIFLNITDNGFFNVTLAQPDTNLVRTIPLNFIKTYRYGVSETLTLHAFAWLDNYNQVTAYHTDANSSLPNVKSIDGFGLYVTTNNTIYFNADKTLAGAVNFWYQFPEVDHIGRSDAYSSLDLGLSTRLLQKKLNISLNLSDAFRNSASAVTTTVNGMTERFSNFQINRYAQLSVSYRFGKKESAIKPGTGNEEERSRTQ